MNFLMKRVNIFKEAPRERFFSLVLYTIKSQYPEGKEWDVCKEKYIYFIITGEHLARKAVDIWNIRQACSADCAYLDIYPWVHV